VPLSADQSRLLATDRWRWLQEVLETWYAEPLTAADGTSTDELATVLIRRRPTTGRPTTPDEMWPGALPEVLVEWFLLVGNRLRDVRDSPATPKSLYGDQDGIAMWTENKAESEGWWTLLVGHDGQCFVNDDRFEFPTVPLPTALHAMVLSDTLVGVNHGGGWDPWGKEWIGPLGKISDRVRGAAIEYDEPPHTLSSTHHHPLTRRRCGSPA